MCFHSFIQYIWLCCFIPLGSTDHLVCDTAFGMQHTKFLGGMCNPVIFGWYLVHLKSPITPGTHLILMWTFHIFICLIFSYILTVFSANSLHQSMVFLLHLHGLSLYWCRTSYFGFLLIHVWLFHLCVKSSLCVGWPVLPSHTREWPTLGDLPI